MDAILSDKFLLQGVGEWNGVVFNEQKVQRMFPLRGHKLKSKVYKFNYRFN